MYIILVFENTYIVSVTPLEVLNFVFKLFYLYYLQRSLHVEALDASLAKRCRSGVAKLHHAKLMH